MGQMSVSEAKQATAKSSAEVFAPLADKALVVLEKFLSPAMTFADPKAQLDAIKFVLDKAYGKTPDMSTGKEPEWMRAVKRAIKINGTAVGDMDPNQTTSNQTIEAEEIIFEFVWSGAA